ncbi:MAG TPA: DUF1501 domain-containing protein [Tepidisphaeraceae bacterium]
MTTRRNLLKVGLGSLPVICLGGTMPAFVSRMAMADPATRPSVSNDNILVVVQLSGGNDGLNTVIPFKADPYYKARPVLGLKQNLLKLNDEHALHPAMGAFKRLYDDGKLAIVNGCGYPKPNRSHFESMAIWHAGDPANAGANGGWVGHYLDHLRRGTSSASAGNVMQAINIGSELPQALVNADAPAPSIQSFEDFSVRLLGRANGTEKLERTLIEEVNRINDASPTLAFLSRQATNAIISTDQIIKIAGGYQSAVEYPAGLGQRLRLIAQIINGNFGTRIFYCEIGGFDTHASQLQQHDNLMRQVSDSISAFTADMAAKGYGDKVTVMCFSEFGRRVAQNDSNGTDHGAAGPMFLVGNKVKGGLHGAMPSLEKENLDDGDLRYTTDFRRVYATLLDGWLNADSTAVLKNKFESMALI